MSPVPRPDNTPAILSAIESTPTASDQEIAVAIGVTPARVAQVRQAQYGKRPRGRKPKGAAPGIPYTVRIPPEIKTYLENRLYEGETLGELMIDGAMERARPRALRRKA